MKDENLEEFEQWIIKYIRDICLLSVSNSKWAIMADRKTIRKYQDNGSKLEEDAVARMIVNNIDMVIERFLLEIENRIAKGKLKVEVRAEPESAWTPLDLSKMLLFQYYDSLISKHSEFKDVSHLLDLLDKERAKLDRRRADLGLEEL